ncbi:hypothetical protein BU16DRAFT_331725 [Lophium mytilinum]|uniref:Uncharacterized protein n=1 Tax=Lophium mytilinum TaxID=390894 RepID=A0A6A6R2E0_9PEZI|nr:hypothetical protein BU16DRAFT_331725 [Lophium mytilinum]
MDEAHIPVSVPWKATAGSIKAITLTSTSKHFYPPSDRLILFVLYDAIIVTLPQTPSSLTKLELRPPAAQHLASPPSGTNRSKAAPPPKRPPNVTTPGVTVHRSTFNLAGHRQPPSLVSLECLHRTAVGPGLSCTQVPSWGVPMSPSAQPSTARLTPAVQCRSGCRHRE